MKRCCLEVFAYRGIAEAFRIAEEGERSQCSECGRWYVKRNGQWRPEDKEERPDA